MPVALDSPRTSHVRGCGSTPRRRLAESIMLDAPAEARSEKLAPPLLAFMLMFMFVAVSRLWSVGRVSVMGGKKRRLGIIPAMPAATASWAEPRPRASHGWGWATHSIRPTVHCVCAARRLQKSRRKEKADVEGGGTRHHIGSVCECVSSFLPRDS